MQDLTPAFLVGFPTRTTLSRAVAVATLVALALLGGEVEPLLFTALITAVLVALVAFKLWSAQRDVAASTAPGATPVAEA